MYDEYLVAMRHKSNVIFKNLDLKENSVNSSCRFIMLDHKNQCKFCKTSFLKKVF